MLESLGPAGLQVNNCYIYFQACGPTIPKDCSSLTMYNGVCLQLGYNNPVPLSLEGKYLSDLNNNFGKMGWEKPET